MKLLSILSAGLLVVSLSASARGANVPSAVSDSRWAGCRIFLAAHASVPQHTAATLLREEVEKRTGFGWDVLPEPRDQVTTKAGAAGCSIDLRVNSQLALRGKPAPPESFTLTAAATGPYLTISITGVDDRGVLFGVGFLLRHLALERGSATPVGGIAALSTEQSPVVTVRGHQLGYRPKNNTFDGWSAAQFEQYIRDLAVFGTNTIELIPPRSDDAAQGPLYTLQPLPMMQAISATLQRYGLDCSIWYPALDKDYTDPAIVNHAVAEWSAVFRALPRVDAVLVPGGDPGHTAPGPLFGLLEREAAALRQSHPGAQMWVSPQSFSQEWMEEFFALLAKQPEWLTGVVYGPEMRISPEEFRRRVPERYPIRFYPDITHTLAAQYPVPDWDAALALTEGREPINPRPRDESILFHRYALKPVSDAVVAYSEGSNDDINKVLWSAWGWDSTRSAQSILEEYGRYFLAPRVAASFAVGVAGLEQNWRGPVRTNASIEPTLRRFQAIEQSLGPRAAHENWRLQQMLYRAHYDAWIKQRLVAEDKANDAAMRLVAQAQHTGNSTQLQQAKAWLDATPRCESAPTCQRLVSLATDLFRTVRMQLSVPRFHALAVDRGANLDRVDAPITSHDWLLAKVDRALAAEAGREASEARATLARELHASLAPDGVVDLPGLSGQRPHVEPGSSFAQDPSGLTGTYQSVAGQHGSEPVPFWEQTFGGTLYDHPLTLHYTHLRSGITYTVDVTYADDEHTLLVQANGKSVAQHCVDEARCTHATIELTPELLPGGKLDLSWCARPGLGGNGRRVKVSRVVLTLQSH